MKASELIAALQKAIEEHGDLQVIHAVTTCDVGGERYWAELDGVNYCVQVCLYDADRGERISALEVWSA